MLKAELLDVLKEAWPMILIFTVIICSIRIVYLIIHHEKIIFYKELFSLGFMIYILVLFYIVTYQDPPSSSISSYNLVPFKEMFRYPLGTNLFYKNIIGNLLIFVPFGLFVSYYLKSKRLGLMIIFILTLISSVTIEFAQRLIVGRVFDVDDIILNVLGGIIGYFLYKITNSIIGCLPGIFKSDGFLNLITIIGIALILIYICNIDLGLMRVLT